MSANSPTVGALKNDIINRISSPLSNVKTLINGNAAKSKIIGEIESIEKEISLIISKIDGTQTESKNENEKENETKSNETPIKKTKMKLFKKVFKNDNNNNNNNTDSNNENKLKHLELLFKSIKNDNLIEFTNLLNECGDITVNKEWCNILNSNKDDTTGHTLLTMASEESNIQIIKQLLKYNTKKKKI